MDMRAEEDSHPRQKGSEVSPHPQKPRIHRYRQPAAPERGRKAFGVSLAENRVNVCAFDNNGQRDNRERNESYHAGSLRRNRQTVPGSRRQFVPRVCTTPGAAPIEVQTYLLSFEDFAPNRGRGVLSLTAPTNRAKSRDFRPIGERALADVGVSGAGTRGSRRSGRRRGRSGGLGVGPGVCRAGRGGWRERRGRRFWRRSGAGWIAAGQAGR